MEKAFSEAVLTRRATRHFSADQVTDDHLRAILEAGLLAPSGYNLQPWRFVVVRDPEVKRRLRAAAMNQRKVEEAPVVIVACGDPDGWRHGDLEEMLKVASSCGANTGSPEDLAHKLQRLFSGQDLDSGGLDGNTSVWVNRQVMIALTTMMWRAEVLGYSTAPMEGFWETKVRAVLQIPAGVRVVALLAIGRRAGQEEVFPGRFDKRRTIFAEEWGNPI